MTVADGVPDGAIKQFADMAQSGGPGLVAIVVFGVVVVGGFIMLYKYMLKPTIEGMMAISNNLRDASANNARAAEQSHAATTENKAIAERLGSGIITIEKMQSVLIDKIAT